MRRPKWRSQVPILVLEWQERAARHAASIQKAGEIMAKTVEFLFDFVSPSSYLAYMALPRIADRADARVVWTPGHLGDMPDALGSAARPSTAARARWTAGGAGARPTTAAGPRWMAEDAARWALHYGIPFQQNSASPVDTKSILLGAVAFMDDPLIRPYCDVIFKALWVDDRDLSRQSELDSIL